MSSDYDKYAGARDEVQREINKSIIKPISHEINY
jgi:hypothetical protein